MANCKSCGAEIEWVEGERTGKPMPLDVGAKPDGNLVVVNGKARAFTAEDGKLHRERRTSHFATCPDAKEWRGGGRS